MSSFVALNKNLDLQSGGRVCKKRPFINLENVININERMHIKLNYSIRASGLP